MDKITQFSCLSCSSTKGKLVLDLGLQPLANRLLRVEQLGEIEPRYPLRLGLCEDCRMLQILDLVPPAEMFTDYVYFSSTSDAMVEHCRQSASRYIKEFKLNNGSFVVEIASNDGYNLQHYLDFNIEVMGIEPAENVAASAIKKGIPTNSEFFSADWVKKRHKENILLFGNNAGEFHADLILANNVLAHVPDINDFVAGIKTLLKFTGTAVLEFPYAMDMIQLGEFDTIYHEHVFYFTMTSLVPLFARHGLMIRHAERFALHGGSLRIFVVHENYKDSSESVKELLDWESVRQVMFDDLYEGFATRTADLRLRLRNCLHQIKESGKAIAAYGASAKGSTLLNYCGIGSETIDFIVDRSQHKHHRLSPGQHIPILPVDNLERLKPEYCLLLTWNFADEILEQQKEYRAAGGKFVIPFPEPRIV